MLSVILVIFGAIIMLCSIIKFYNSLVELKTQIKSLILFSKFIYAACFFMTIFFLAGYIITAVDFIIDGTIIPHKILIAVVFFFGAIFVLLMITMIRQMFAALTDKAELQKQLKQQELMTTISQSFTTTEEPSRLINKALMMSGKFMKANHVFLAAYIKEDAILECRHEWYDEKSRPFTGEKNRIHITPDMKLYDDLINKGYAAVNNCQSLAHSNFINIKDYNLGALLNIPIDVSGKFWGVLGFILCGSPHDWDISDINLGRQIAGIFSGAIGRNQIDEELIRAKELAEQGSKSKSEFLSRMSHEIRTPMNAVVGMTGIGLNSDDIKRKNYCLEKISTASTHLLGIINDILDMSKIEANKLELNCTDFNLSMMLEKIISVTGYQMEEKKLAFTLSISPDVPKAIKSDEQRLSQVITNLLGNAVKFTPDKGCISLFIRKLQTGSNTVSNRGNEHCILQFEVKDTGIGISEEKQNCLFKPFTQADGSISRKYGGTGLGLAISKRIIELLNGSIKVNSKPGQGTSFIFDIQAETVQPDCFAAAPPSEADAEIKYQNGCFKHITALIAEDIEINREIIAALLEYTGITIDFAMNGKAAYELYSANPLAYNIIFMDIHMPEVDGYEATKMIRLLDKPGSKTIPIIAMTADVFQEDIEKCLAAGMNDHVGKPLNINDILGKISAYCTKEQPVFHREQAQSYTDAPKEAASA